MGTRCQNSSSYGFFDNLTQCGRCFGRKQELQTCVDCKGSHKRNGKKVEELCSKCKSFIRESAPRWPNRNLPSEIVNTDPAFYNNTSATDDSPNGIKGSVSRRRLTHRPDSP